jgi:hypothetical protein
VHGKKNCAIAKGGALSKFAAMQQFFIPSRRVQVPYNFFFRGDGKKTFFTAARTAQFFSSMKMDPLSIVQKLLEKCYWANETVKSWQLFLSTATMMTRERVERKKIQNISDREQSKERE